MGRKRKVHFLATTEVFVDVNDDMSDDVGTEVPTAKRRTLPPPDEDVRMEDANSEIGEWANGLPVEIWELVAEYLPPGSARMASTLVCKGWTFALGNSWVWRARVMTDFAPLFTPRDVEFDKFVNSTSSAYRSGLGWEFGKYGESALQQKMSTQPLVAYSRGSYSADDVVVGDGSVVYPWGSGVVRGPAIRAAVVDGVLQPGMPNWRMLYLKLLTLLNPNNAILPVKATRGHRLSRKPPKPTKARKRKLDGDQPAASGPAEPVAVLEPDELVPRDLDWIKAAVPVALARTVLEPAASPHDVAQALPLCPCCGTILVLDPETSYFKTRGTNAEETLNGYSKSGMTTQEPSPFIQRQWWSGYRRLFCETEGCGFELDRLSTCVGCKCLVVGPGMACSSSDCSNSAVPVKYQKGLPGLSMVRCLKCSPEVGRCGNCDRKVCVKSLQECPCGCGVTTCSTCRTECVYADGLGEPCCKVAKESVYCGSCKLSVCANHKCKDASHLPPPRRARGARALGPRHQCRMCCRGCWGGFKAKKDLRVVRALAKLRTD